MNTVPLAREATLEDLRDVDGRAELIDGEIVRVTPTGHRPNRSARRITVSLDAHESLRGGGCAVGEGAGFVLRTPRTQVLSPDAAWWPGNVIAAGQIDGAPSFAAEVRSESDYGPAAERAMAIKRNLYFAAGTQVVWDVDVLREVDSSLPRRSARFPNPLSPRRSGRCGTSRAGLEISGRRPLFVRRFRSGYADAALADERVE